MIILIILITCDHEDDDKIGKGDEDDDMAVTVVAVVVAAVTVAVAVGDDGLIDSGNSLVTLGIKTFLEPMLAQIYLAIWYHNAKMSKWSTLYFLSHKGEGNE